MSSGYFYDTGPWRTVDSYSILKNYKNKSVFSVKKNCCCSFFFAAAFLFIRTYCTLQTCFQRLLVRGKKTRCILTSSSVFAHWWFWAKCAHMLIVALCNKLTMYQWNLDHGCDSPTSPVLYSSHSACSIAWRTHFSRAANLPYLTHSIFTKGADADFHSFQLILDMT